MKASVIALIGMAVIGFSQPAFAGGGLFMELLDETHRDFDTVKSNFRAAYTAGYSSWEDYGAATGFSIGEVEERINRRRAVLAALKTSAGSPERGHERGVVKMVIADLDYINLSLQALIRDDKGYSGYIRTMDRETLDSVSGWQEGIRQALSELRRSARMVNRVRAQVDSGTVAMPVSLN